MRQEKGLPAVVYGQRLSLDERLSTIRMNCAKTEVSWRGSRHRVDRIIVPYVLWSSVTVVDAACDLGVIIAVRWP